jgi:hypothetical protein
MHFSHLACVLPNGVVEWLAPLLRTREIVGSNIGPAVLTELFVVFLSLSVRIPGYCITIWPRPLPSESFTIHHSRYIVVTEESASPVLFSLTIAIYPFIPVF